MWVYKLHKLKNLTKTYDNMSQHANASYNRGSGYKIRSYSESHTQVSDEQREKIVIYVFCTMCVDWFLSETRIGFFRV